MWITEIIIIFAEKHCETDIMIRFGLALNQSHLEIWDVTCAHKAESTTCRQQNHVSQGRVQSLKVPQYLNHDERFEIVYLCANIFAFPLLRWSSSIKFTLLRVGMSSVQLLLPVQFVLASPEDRFTSVHCFTIAALGPTHCAASRNPAQQWWNSAHS
jgi:hypothetical protein